jgi:hypothetical protein
MRLLAFRTDRHRIIPFRTYLLSVSPHRQGPTRPQSPSSSFVIPSPSHSSDTSAEMVNFEQLWNIDDLPEHKDEGQVRKDVERSFVHWVGPEDGVGWLFLCSYKTNSNAYNLFLIIVSERRAETHDERKTREAHSFHFTEIPIVELFPGWFFA